MNLGVGRRVPVATGRGTQPLHRDIKRGEGPPSLGERERKLLGTWTGVGELGYHPGFHLLLVDGADMP